MNFKTSILFVVFFSVPVSIVSITYAHRRLLTIFGGVFMQCSYWFLTINPNAKCYNELDDILKRLSVDNPLFRYSYITHSVLENEDAFNINHMHLVMYFGKKVKRFETIQNLFVGAHIEFTNRNRYYRCIQYLIHKNEFKGHKYSINDITTNYSFEELTNIIDFEGYEFEFFNSSLISDYILECFRDLPVKHNINMCLLYFINRFGIDAIKPYYFILKDLILSYND